MLVATALLFYTHLGPSAPDVSLNPSKATVAAWNQAWATRFLSQGMESESATATLWTARESFGKIAVLAHQYELSRDQKYADRAAKELLYAVSRKDWQPSSFLTTAEYLMGTSIGLLRLGPSLSAKDRETVRAGIVENGLTPALRAYKKKEEWTSRTNNWGQVCSSAVLLGLMAAPGAEDAVELKEFAQRHYESCLGYLGGTGISPEGPTYWRYGWNALWLADLERKSAQNPRLLNPKHFESMAHVAWMMRAPSGMAFNFGDSSENFTISPFMLDLASRANFPTAVKAFSDDLAAQLAARGSWNEEWRFLPFLLDVEDKSANKGAYVMGAPIGFTTGDVNRIQLTVINSEYSGKNTPWVGIKAGSNGEPHGHLDLGSFIYETFGERWSIDLGKDDYDLPGYFEGGERGRRWKYLRPSTLSHSVLSFEGKNQLVKATAKSTFNSLRGLGMSANVDLSKAYAPWCQSVTRTLELDNPGNLRIVDAMEGGKARGQWAMTTRASITLEKNVATLAQGSNRLKATIIQPKGLVWETQDLTPQLPAENPNTGARQLLLRFPKGTRTIEITLVPQLSW